MTLKLVRKALVCAGLTMLVLSPVNPSFAASDACMAGIERVQVQLDAALARRAAAGPSAKETSFATMNRQPTPATVARAEAQLGDWPGATKAVAALRSARQAQAAGDRRGCLNALRSARSAIRG